MGRRLARLDGFPGLGIRITLTVFNVEEMDLWRQQLMYSVSCFTEGSSRFLIVLFITQSGPGAERLFSLRSAA